MIKKIQVRYFFFFLACLLAPTCHSDDDDDFSLDDISLADIVQYETENVGTKGGPDPIPFIASALSTIVPSPLWQNTMAPKGRDILYLLPHKITALEFGGFACNLFFNMTDKLHVSAKSLLDLTSLDQNKLNTFIEALKDLLPPNISPEEIVGLLPLLQKITIQERKGGAFLQGGFIRGPFTIQLHTSLQFSERNFWISPNDRDIITEVGNKIAPGQKLDDREFYRLKYGMGDTRLKAGINTLNLTNFQTDVGIEAILPTSRFSSAQPTLTPPPTITTDLAQLQMAGIDLLRGLREYLLNPQLGNGGHFGLGCYFESKIGIFHNLAQLWTRMSYDSLFPGEEMRLIMFKKTIEPSALDVPTTQLIDTFVQQYIFPTPFKVTTQPGGIFNFVTSVNIDMKKWQLALGYDFYAQQQEQILEIHNSNDNPNVLRIEDAESIRSMQHKVFTELVYVQKYAKSDLRLGVGGDATVHSSGIGYDWTLYFKIATSF